MRPSHASPVFRLFAFRTLGAGSGTLLPTSIPSYKLSCLAELHVFGEQQEKKYQINVCFLGPESEKDLYHIRRVILSVANRTVQDVVQALKRDESCSHIRLTSHLVDCIIPTFGDDWKSALVFFQWATLQSGYSHTTYTCNKIIDLLGKMKQVNEMWKVVKEMHKGGIVTLETVAKIMRRLAGAGRWKDAVKVFDDLGSMGLEKNTEAMNLLLDTLCKEKKVEVAREVYLNLKAYIPPDAYTFNIFVHGWCSARRIDEAIWTIQEMKGSGFHPSVITYSTIIQAYCNQLKFSKAYDLLDEMVANACQPNVITYTIIMHSLAKSCKFEEALSVVERMKLSGCEPDIIFYNSLINVLGRAGQVDKLLHIFGVEMQKNGVNCNLSTYNTMISILCSHNREHDALKVLRIMENSSCRPVPQTFLPLLKLCFKTRMGDDHLKALLKDMANKYHLSLDLDTYTLLIHGLCSIGNIEWACLLLDEMVSREIFPRSRTLKVLMYEAEQKNMEVTVERFRYLMKPPG